MSVPKNMQGKYDEIAALITPFCDEYLNDEYKALCLYALEKLCRKRPSPLLSGRARTWAGAILYAVGQANFLFDKSQTPHMKASELAERIGVGNSTLSAKAKELQKMLKMQFFSAEWTLPSRMEDNPFIWMVTGQRHSDGRTVAPAGSADSVLREGADSLYSSVEGRRGQG